jgi:activator of 2-hydroxyglutaryl-CoA dehydratase
MDFLVDFKLNNEGTAVADQYTACGIFDMENRVHVFITDFNEEGITRFKETVCDSECIVFAKSEAATFDNAGVNPDH